MANILDTYGIKEVADVTMYEIVDNAGEISYKPVLFLDTLKVSTIEQTAEQTSARGGKGNPELIIWDYGKEITLNLEDALFSPQSMNIMLGGMEGGKLVDMDTVTSINRMQKVEIKETTTVPSGDEKWYSTADFSLLEAGTTVNAGTFVYQEKPTAVTGKTINITAANFPGTYRIVGETYARSQKTGKDEYFQFEIPKAKMGAENTITLEAEGDPTVFNMTMKVLRPDDGIMMKLTQFNLDETPVTKHTVTFDVTTNASDLTVTTAPAAQTVAEGGKATAPTGVTAKTEGYTVVWKNGSDDWDFSTDTVTGDVTLVATAVTE